MALDITEGKLFLRFDLGERQGANQEIVHAKALGNRRPIERRPRALPGLPALREQLQKRAVGPRTKLGLLTRTGVAGPAAIGSGATQGWG